ncbi:Peroxin 13, N-terminal region-domain-containing protein [Chytriomyces sp. MP71]|nr:Peroxin 13, N-terminal region-domain-containing protein [Chytriomyces sp. MP71]
MAPSPPKPWETSVGTTSAPIQPSPEDFSSFQGGSEVGPAVPNRPATLDSSFNNVSRFGTTTGGYGMGGVGGAYGVGSGLYGTSPYEQGGYGVNRFNRFAAGATPYGTGYGGYGGGMYGGGMYGGGMYGGGMYGGGMNNGFGMRPGMGPANPGEIPLTQQIEQSTQQAFQSMDQIVQAFTGFSQMLESTFFATHSSFMAMVGVAEQLGYLRSYLGGVVSALAFSDQFKKWYYFATGQPIPVDAKALTAEGFDKFANSGKSKANRRPVLLFLLFMFGFPWLMSKLIQRLQQKQLEAAAVNPVAGALLGPDGTPLQASQIKELEFCKALFDFAASSPAELSFKKGDIVAILSKVDPMTREASMWWRGRLRTGEIGLFPSNYVEVIAKRDPIPAIGLNTHISANTPSEWDDRARDAALKRPKYKTLLRFVLRIGDSEVETAPVDRSRDRRICEGKVSFWRYGCFHTLNLVVNMLQRDRKIVGVPFAMQHQCLVNRLNNMLNGVSPPTAPVPLKAHCHSVLQYETWAAFLATERQWGLMIKNAAYGNVKKAIRGYASLGEVSLMAGRGVQRLLRARLSTGSETRRHEACPTHLHKGPLLCAASYVPSVNDGASAWKFGPFENGGCNIERFFVKRDLCAGTVAEPKRDSFPQGSPREVGPKGSRQIVVTAEPQRREAPRGRPQGLSANSSNFRSTT